MFTDRNDTWNTRRTVVAYAAAGAIVVSLINLLLAALGLDDGSPADFVRGASFIALTSLLLWLLLNSRRRRLEALREHAEIQQALAGQSNDVLMLEDDTGLIVTVNRRAEETYALTGAALLGLRTRDLRFPEARAGGRCRPGPAAGRRRGVFHDGAHDSRWAPVPCGGELARRRNRRPPLRAHLGARPDGQSCASATCCGSSTTCRSSA